MTAKEAAPLLAQLSGEKLSQTEFREYVKDYANNPEEYELDREGDYFKAIVEAYDSRQDYWIEYCKFFDDPPIKDIVTLTFDWKECQDSALEQIGAQLTSLGLHVYEMESMIGSDCNGLIISKKKYDTAEEAEIAATPEFQIEVGDMIIDFMGDTHKAVAVGTYEETKKYDKSGACLEVIAQFNKPEFLRFVATSDALYQIDWDGAHKYYGK